MRAGLILHLPRSTGDRTGRDRWPRCRSGRTGTCSVAADDAYVAAGKLQNGAPLGAASKTDGLLARRLSGRAATVIIQRMAGPIGLDPARMRGSPGTVIPRGDLDDTNIGLAIEHALDLFGIARSDLRRDHVG